MHTAARGDPELPIHIGKNPFLLCSWSDMRLEIDSAGVYGPGQVSRGATAAGGLSGLISPPVLSVPQSHAARGMRSAQTAVQLGCGAAVGTFQPHPSTAFIVQLPF